AVLRVPRGVKVMAGEQESPKGTRLPGGGGRTGHLELAHAPSHLRGGSPHPPGQNQEGMIQGRTPPPRTPPPPPPPPTPTPPPPVHRVTLPQSFGPKAPCASKRMRSYADGRLGHALPIGADEDGERNYTPHHAMHPPVSSLLAGKSDPPAEYYCPNTLRYSST